MAFVRSDCYREPEVFRRRAAWRLRLARPPT